MITIITLLAVVLSIAIRKPFFQSWRRCDNFGVSLLGTYLYIATFILLAVCFVHYMNEWQVPTFL